MGTRVVLIVLWLYICVDSTIATESWWPTVVAVVCFGAWFALRKVSLPGRGEPPLSASGSPTSTLDLYLIRCQRNALWVALPLASLAAFVSIVPRAVPHASQGLLEQYVAIVPFACVAVSLTHQLAARADDMVQRFLAFMLALGGMAAFVLGFFASAPGWSGLDPSLMLYPAALGAWSLLAVALIPCQPRPAGGLAWWRVLTIVSLVGALPAVVALGTTPSIIWFPSYLLMATGPPAFALACATSGSPKRLVLVAASLGAVVGACMDLRTPLPGVPKWTLELALLYGAAALTAHVASRALGMTVVRRLDGEAPRLPSLLAGPPRRAVQRLVSAVFAVAATSLVLGASFVRRSRLPSATVPTERAREGVMGCGGAIQALRKSGIGGRKAVVPRSSDTTVVAGGLRQNAGSEAVWQAFLSQQWSIGTSEDDPLTGDADGDGREEFVDPWGNPYVYFDCSDYEAAAASGAAYVRRDGVEVRARPRFAPNLYGSDDSEIQGLFQSPAGFQFFSMGPDGLPNTDDDIDSGQ